MASLLPFYSVIFSFSLIHRDSQFCTFIFRIPAMNYKGGGSKAKDEKRAEGDRECEAGWAVHF